MITYDFWNSKTSLARWNNALIGMIESGMPDLTNRQMAVLLIVCLEDGPHTIRGLAARLCLSTPVVCRSLDRLSELGYVRRTPDINNRRSVFVVPENDASKLLDDLAALWATATDPH